MKSVMANDSGKNSAATPLIGTLLIALRKLYFVTIDRSNFREVASRIAVFTVPIFCYGREINWWGLVFAIMGLAIRAWGAGYLQKDQKIAMGGPYLLVRHPLYLGSCLLALALVVTINHWFVTLFVGGMTILIYHHRITHEDKDLIAHFGEAYREYTKIVGPLWPKAEGLKRFLGSLKTSGTQFSLQQYIKNKEYECLLGVVTVFAMLHLISRYTTPGYLR
jgi:protein-S-isoprenylcysteine O-methyltransferase Ste14